MMQMMVKLRNRRHIEKCQQNTQIESMPSIRWSLDILGEKKYFRELKTKIIQEKFRNAWNCVRIALRNQNKQNSAKIYHQVAAVLLFFWNIFSNFFFVNSFVGMMFVSAKKTVWNITQKHHKSNEKKIYWKKE